MEMKIILYWTYKDLRVLSRMPGQPGLLKPLRITGGRRPAHMQHANTKKREVQWETTCTVYIYIYIYIYIFKKLINNSGAKHKEKS